MDRELRHYRRLAAQGDINAAAQVLIIRIRKSDLPRRNVEIAAMLGHQPSILGVGKQEVPTSSRGIRFWPRPRVEPLHDPEMGTGIGDQGEGISKFVFDLIWLCVILIIY